MNDLPRFLRLMRPVRGLMLAGFVLACLAQMASFGLLFLSGWLLAGAAVAGLGGVVTQNLFNLFLPAAGVRFFATTRILARYAERLVTHDAALRVVSLLREWSFARLIPRSPLLTGCRSGDVLARFVSDTDRLGQYPAEVLLPFGVAAVSGIVAIGVTACFSVPVALVLAGALLVAGGLIPLLTGRKTDQTQTALAEASDGLRADLVETIQGLGDIALCGATHRTVQALAARQTALDAAQFRLASFSHAARQSVTFLAVLTAVAASGLAAQALRQDALSAAELPMLALGCLAAFEPVAGLVTARQAAGRAKISAYRVGALCDSPVPVCQPENSAEVPAHVPLEMRDVFVTLPGSSIPVLRGCSLTLHPGERIAVTGASGAGKSTLVRTLMRLADYQSGSVLLGGVELNRFSTQVLSQTIAVLSQNFHLFQGSIRRNLLIAAPDADEDSMWSALKAAQCDGEVRAMDQGLDTLTGEHGTCLSGGQARRLAVAQVLLRRPDILLLDEPTEGLSPEAGSALIASLLEALPDAAVLCITHRPEPLAFMDRIVRLEAGEICEREALP